MKGTHILDFCEDLGVAQLFPSTQDGVGVVFPNRKLILAADGFLTAMVGYRHIIASTRQPGQVSVHFVGDSDIGAAQGKALRQIALHCCRVGFVYQDVLSALLGTVCGKPPSVRALPWSAAGPEMDRHLVHSTFLKLKQCRAPLTDPFPAGRS